MTAVQHVFKRGSVYRWRRRLPIGTGRHDWVRLELSLDTKELERARRIAPEVTLASHRLQPDLKNKMIPTDIARQILIKVARETSDWLDAIKSGSSRDPESNRRSETASGWAYRLLAAQGREAVVGPVEEQDLRDAGLDDELIGQIRSTLKFYQENNFARVGKTYLEGLLKQYGIPPSSLDLGYAEALYLRGHAAALLNKQRRWSGIREDDLAMVQDALKTSSAPPPGSPEPVRQRSMLSLSPRQPWQPPGNAPSMPIASPRAEPEPNTTNLAIPDDDGEPDIEVDDDIEFADADDPAGEPDPKIEQTPGLVEIVRQAAGEKVILKDWRENMAKQHVNIAKLFVRFIGHDQPQMVRQVDISRFRSLLYKLPKNHGKSPKDHKMSIADLVARAEGLPPDKVGMSMSTINRYMTQVNNIADICKHAGYPFHDYEGVSGLRARKKSDPRGERGKFDFAELKAIFSLPVWAGSVDEERRFEPGESVFHDAAYWVPLLSIYNGARREENCGLLLSEIEDEDELPCFRFEINGLRLLKNLQSKRRVPIHPELIRLGFLDYVQTMRRMGHDLLFPELRAANGGTALGDVFDVSWQKIRAAALPNAKEERKVLHSMRHWCNNEMKQSLIFAEIRRDIMGHTTGDVNEGRYSDPERLKVMADAMAVLPLPSADLSPHPIRLIKQVVSHTPRASRTRKRT